MYPAQVHRFTIGSRRPWGAVQLVVRPYQPHVTDEMISTTEAARLLNITPQAVRDRIAAGQLTAELAGGCWRVRRATLPDPPPGTHTRPAATAVSPVVAALTRRVTDAAGTSGLIPVAVAADIAGVGVGALRHGLRDNTIPGGRKIGGNWHITVIGLMTWLDLPTAAS